MWPDHGCLLPGFLAVPAAVRLQSLGSLLTTKTGRKHSATSFCFAALSGLCQMQPPGSKTANIAAELHQFGQGGTTVQ